MRKDPQREQIHDQLPASRRAVRHLPVRLILWVTAAGLGGALLIWGAVAYWNSDTGRVSATVGHYFSAVAGQNYQAACALLDHPLRTDMTGGCPDALRRQYASMNWFDRGRIGNASARNVTFSTDRRTAHVADADIRRSQTITTGTGSTRRTTTTTYPVPDLTRGDGFTLVRSGREWLISKGV